MTNRQLLRWYAKGNGYEGVEMFYSDIVALHDDARRLHVDAEPIGLGLELADVKSVSLIGLR